jgi:hypothetical protein
MQSYNHIASAIFDFLMAPFGHEMALFDLMLWPVIMGIGALLVYKYTSNQKAIARVKTQISMHLLEIRLFRDDIAQVLKSTIAIVAKNTIYIGHNLLPMAVMLVPMIALMVQLVAHYAYEPTPPGAVELLQLKLDPNAPVSARDVSLELPEGVSLDAPVVRTADGQVYWRVRADRAGDHVLRVRVAGETYEKGWAVGGGARKIPIKRLRDWEALLYPGEAAIARDAPVLSLELDMRTRPIAYVPDGEVGILLWAMGVSLVAGVALKDFFGVTL